MEKKIKALILFANPKGTSKLKLSKERKIITETLRKLLEDKKTLQIKFVDGSTIHDLREELLKGEYNILQISGHGTTEGLILERENGKPHVIKPEALAGLLKKYKSLECVIFNACYSNAQGAHTAAHIPFTIAMWEAIEDEAAREFSRGFYGAVATGKSYEFAFNEGCDTVQFAEENLFSAELMTPESVKREAAYEKTANSDDHSPKTLAPSGGNVITVNGNRNVAVGGNFRNSKIYLGDSTNDSGTENDR